MTQDRNKWRAVVNAVMKLRVAYSRGNFFTSSLITRFCRGALLHVVRLSICDPPCFSVNLITYNLH